MSGTHDAGGVMYIQSNVVFQRELRLAGMHADAHPDRDALGPGMACQSALDGYSCRCRIGGSRKGHEESVPIDINLSTLPYARLLTSISYTPLSSCPCNQIKMHVYLR